MQEIITIGAGCFWCVEAVFKELVGVEEVVPGYMGGHKKDPTYEEVCTGETGHAEVLQITFDSSKIEFTELLEIFWKIHDPTTLNRQGNDIGTQYRSAIFYHDSKQLEEAKISLNELVKSGIHDRLVVTEIQPAAEFYPAEKYHHDYFALNGSQPYCQVVVRPKVEKFKKTFKNKLKDEF